VGAVVSGNAFFAEPHHELRSVVGELENLMGQMLDEPDVLGRVVRVDLNAMRGAFGEEILILGPRVDQLSATVEDHQDVFVQPALLATLLEDAFEQSKRASLDVVLGRYGFHRRLLAPHEDEDTILRLGPHRRNRTPRPAIGVHR